MTKAYLAVLLLLCLSHPSHGDNWTCVEESSRREAGGIFACGIGVAKDEDRARAAAFQSATNEFMRICIISSDCANHETTVIPGRTSCETFQNGVKCYRAVTFEIGDEKEPKKEQKTVVLAPVAPRPRGHAPIDWDTPWYSAGPDLSHQ